MKCLILGALLTATPQLFAAPATQTRPEARQAAKLAKLLPGTLIVRVSKTDPNDVAVVHLKKSVPKGAKLTNLAFQKAVLDEQVAGIPYESNADELDANPATEALGFAIRRGPYGDGAYIRGPNGGFIGGYRRNYGGGYYGGGEYYGGGGYGNRYGGGYYDGGYAPQQLPYYPQYTYAGYYNYPYQQYDYYQDAAYSYYPCRPCCAPPPPPPRPPCRGECGGNGYGYGGYGY